MTENNIDRASVHVIRTARKTISIQIKADGIYVRAPFRMNDAEIQRFLESKEGWIRKHLQMVTGRNATIQELPRYSYEETRALADNARQVIPGRVKYYAGIIGVDYGNITIRNQRNYEFCPADTEILAKLIST